MIDTASFLNSKDIADYWYKIGWNSYCTPLQSAYIVWQNHTKTLQEKHAAWREIVETMPDCIVAEGHRKTNMGISDALAESLHAFLQAFMELQNQLIERFEFLHQHVANIRTVKTADLNQRIVQPQQAHDILARGVVGCGGQRHKRQRREPLAQLTERGIFRAEIVAPLGDTVRFING